MKKKSLENGPDLALEFKAEPQNLVLIRNFIGCLAKHLDLTPEEALQLEICVDEACANSVDGIRAVEGNQPITNVRLGFRFQEEGIELTIQDGGQDYSLHFYNAYPLDDKTDRTRKRGYGLQIIKKLMDEVVYEYDPETGNRLYLRKFFQS